MTIAFEAGGRLTSGALLNPWGAVKTAAQALVCDEGVGVPPGPVAAPCSGSAVRIPATLVPEPGHEGGVLITWPAAAGHTYTVAPAP